MAGTRLLLNLVAVGQLLVLLGSSLYFGLCHRHYDGHHGVDFLCIPLFHQGGRSLLQQERKRMNELERLSHKDWGTIASVVIGVALEDDRTIWESILRTSNDYKSPYDQIDVQLVDKSLLQSVCDGTHDNNESEEMSRNQIDVWICPELMDGKGSQQSSTPWVLLNDGSIALHRKSTAQQAMQDWQTIYPDASEAPSYPLQNLVLTMIWESNQQQQQQQQEDESVTLLLDRLQTWFPHNLLQASYLWNSNIEINFVVHNLSDKARRIQQDHFDSEMNSTFTTISYEMEMDDITRGLDEVFEKNDTEEEPWRITLWIPSLEPMLLVDTPGEHWKSNNTSSSHLLQVSNRHWFGLLHQQQQHEQAGKDLVEEILERLLARAFGIPETVVDSLVLMDEIALVDGSVDGSLLPTLYFKLWKQRRIRSLYQHAVSELRSEYNRLLQSRRTVAITRDVVQAWSDIAFNMEQAVQQGDKELGATLQNLQYALQQLQALRQNPDLVEPLDLSIDHYAGIFVPLLVPLLIPMLLGVIRETRRYRGKIKKKRVSGGKEKKD